MHLSFRLDRADHGIHLVAKALAPRVARLALMAGPGVTLDAALATRLATEAIAGAAFLVTAFLALSFLALATLTVVLVAPFAGSLRVVPVPFFVR